MLPCRGVMHTPSTQVCFRVPTLIHCHACAEPVPKTKRPVDGPRNGFTLEGVTAETITPIPYDIIKEGLKT